MNKRLLKGNEAVVFGSLLAGCSAYYGYPITPASEIAHTAAKFFPLLNRTFLQAESEIAAINMVFGAAAAGVRVMTASSGPGISLKQEGVSFLAGCELPCLIVYIMRAGPGLGNIGPSQADYNQIIKGGGHGDYKCIILAPNSAQEMCDFAIKGFNLSDKYRTPVYILTDGVIGQMMEPVTLPEPFTNLPSKEWALEGNKKTSSNCITSIFLDFNDLEQHNIKLHKKYRLIEKKESDYQTYMLKDAEIILIGYGVMSRVLKTVVDILRERNIKAGMFRPITLFPFPKKQLRKITSLIKKVLVVELSFGQLYEDVKAIIPEDCDIELSYRVGGNCPEVSTIINKCKKMMR